MNIQKLLQQGLAAQQANDLDTAWKTYQKILAAEPTQPDALHLSGVIANQKGDHARAAELIGKALKRAPQQAFFHINLGTALAGCGRKAEAEAAFRQAVALDPRLAAAYFNLANLLAGSGREDEAIALYDQAIVLDPRHVNAMFALARLLSGRRLFPVAERLLQQAARLAPQRHDVLLFLARVQLETGRAEDCLGTVDGVLQSNPRNVDALVLKGDALANRRRPADAIGQFRHALELDPQHLPAHRSLAQMLDLCGSADAAAALLATQLERHPDELSMRSDWLFLLNYSSTLSQAEILAAHRSWDAAFDAAPASAAIERDNVVDPDRRLRVGYVSGDFRRHSVAFFIEPILERHDRQRFEVFGYSTCPPGKADDLTQRLAAHADVWRDVSLLDDDQLAALIARDRIDVLIDLAGHTGGNRLPVFARRPAPVQVNYLGYPNTTGLAAIGYRISDAIADPPGDGERWNSEALLRLPDCFHCYRPFHDRPFDALPPSQTTGSITFASFNVLAKISAPCVAAWARILHAVEDSRLLLKTRALADPGVAAQLRERFAEHGIAAPRLLLEGFVEEMIDHQQRYRGVDIALDTFPYNGTTTTCEALWMGVPVVTFAGARHAGRVGASLLRAIDEPSLVAGDVDGYVERAVALAHDQAALHALHGRLRERMRRSPLMDEKRFVDNLESAYRTAWQTWCSQEAARAARPDA